MFKYLKWFVGIAFFIAGIYFIQLTAKTGIQPAILAVFCFGMTFWLSKSTYESSKAVMVGSTVTVVGSGFLSRYFLGDFVANTFGLDLNFYVWWLATSFILGIPVMLYAFKKSS